MRPDEHKRRKNEKYKKKQPVTAKPEAERVRVKVKPALESNADRYADLDLEAQTTGRNLQDLLSTTTGQAVFPTPTEDDCSVIQMLDTLALDISSIEKAMDCFSLSDILGLPRIHNDLLKGSPGTPPDYAHCLTDYLHNDLDTVYVVDHLSKMPQADLDVIYTNTGRHLTTPTAVNDLPSSGEAVETESRLTHDAQAAAGGAQFVGDASSDFDDDLEKKQVELEDWLDSVLDD